MIFVVSLKVCFLNLHLFESQDFRGIVAFAQGTGKEESGFNS